VTTYQITLYDRETQIVVGYYNGAWTTDRRRALVFRRREAAQAHAARMRDRCPRNAELINVEDRLAVNNPFRQRAACGHGPRQRSSCRATHPKGAVYAHGREFATIAVSIMQESAKRLGRSNGNC
jgi:hypothetical protein